MMNEKVETLMITKLITLGPKDTLADASEIFRTRKIHHIPIVEEGKLLGLVTTYDMWKRHVNPDDYSTTHLEAIMSKNIIKIEAHDKIGTAAEIFLDNRFHCLPVVGDNDILLGLVTTFDILKYEFRKEYPNPILYKEVFEGEDSEK